MFRTLSTRPLAKPRSAKRLFHFGNLMLFVALLSSCQSKPSTRHLQFVARDAWDATCASQAIIETFDGTNRRWKIEDQIYLVDVKADFIMANDCKSGLPLIGKSYKQSQHVHFEKKGLELSSCKVDGTKGWSLPGKESTRCWTSATEIPKEMQPDFKAAAKLPKVKVKFPEPKKPEDGK